jgi:23S rRNA (cytosine1962-C5)-methyltransferase
MNGTFGVDGGALPQVEISARAARRLSAGYLWVYSNEVEGRDDPGQAAYWCRFVRAGRTLATGYYNRHSLIAGRVVGPPGTTDLEHLLVERLRQAMRRRSRRPAGEAARLVFSESDRLPGLVVDHFPPFAVLQSNTAGMDLALPFLEKRLPEVYAELFGATLQGLVLRCDSGIRQLEAVEPFRRIAFGDPAAIAAAEVVEDGVRYAADLAAGQKTGFFLDQRDNRARFGQLIRETPAARVLDLFCYSGGWGVRALREGAAQVTFVDQSADALRLVERGMQLNGLAPGRGELHVGDVFDFLERAQGGFDAVVTDPPAFAKSRKHLPKALKAYGKLNRLAWRQLKPGGVLFACSCSYHLSETDLLNLLSEAIGRDGGAAHVIHRGMQAEDHPVLLSMPETCYLKCVGLRKLDPA